MGHNRWNTSTALLPQPRPPVFFVLPAMSAVKACFKYFQMYNCYVLDITWIHRLVQYLQTDQHVANLNLQQ